MENALPASGAWGDVRRHDYQNKDMEPPVNQKPVLEGGYIRRIFYPSTERERNGSNVPDAALSDYLGWDTQD